MQIYFIGILSQNQNIYKENDLYINYSNKKIFAINSNKNIVLENLQCTIVGLDNVLVMELIPKKSPLKIVSVDKQEFYTYVKVVANVITVTEKIIDQKLEEKRLANSEEKETLIDSFIDNTTKYLIFLTQNITQSDACLININSFVKDEIKELFPEKKITKKCMYCPYDSRILIPELNNNSSILKCQNHCNRSLIKEYPQLQKKIINRYIKNLQDGLYNKKSDSFPALLTDEEIDFLNNDQKRKSQTWERKLNLKDKLHSKTNINKRNNAIYFNGNNLNPIPNDLFQLWRYLMDNYRHKFVNFSHLETTTESRNVKWRIVETDMQDYAGLGHYELPDNILYGSFNKYLFPYNTSIAMSVYFDEELKEDLFYIAIQTEQLDVIYFDNNNQLIMLADENLKAIYNYWKEYRVLNKSIYNQKYRLPILEDDIYISKETICETCLLKEYCNKEYCYYSDSDIEILKNEHFRVNLHLNNRDEEHLPLSHWKHIIDNCANSMYVKEFNLTGYEPMLYPEVEELIEYIESLNINCSISTSGVYLTNEWIERHVPFLSSINLMIDSLNSGVLTILQRTDEEGNYVDYDRLTNLCQLIKNNNPNCEIIIETNVVQANKYETISTQVLKLDQFVSMWKIIQREITDNDFEYFVEFNHNAIIDSLKLPDNYDEIGLMNIYETENNLEIIIDTTPYIPYIMINNEGYLMEYKNNKLKKLVNCATETFFEDFKKITKEINLYFSKNK